MAGLGCILVAVWLLFGCCLEGNGETMTEFVCDELLVGLGGRL